MKHIKDFIFEGQSSAQPKPIHLFKNDGSIVNENYFNRCFEDIEKEWSAAVQDGHEDEYVYITSDNKDYQKYFDKYCITSKIIDGEGSRGIGFADCGWHKYKTSKYPFYRVYRGTSDRKVFTGILIGDKHHFED